MKYDLVKVTNTTVDVPAGYFQLVSKMSEVLSCGAGGQYSNNMRYLVLLQSRPGYEMRLQVSFNSWFTLSNPNLNL